MSTHSFAICAYKENPFLEETIKSVLNQSVRSEVFIVTSTPNPWIRQMAEKYHLDMFVNNGTGTIASNWSFAYACAETEYVTITHQDDLFEPEYAEHVSKAAENNEDAIILYTDYYELRQGMKESQSLNLKIKRLMNRTMSLIPWSKHWRKLILSFGCPICCPSVTYHKSRIRDFAFDPEYTDCLDWEAYLRLVPRKGKFVYIAKKLISHRIYEGSITTSAISDGCRSREEQRIFESLWPKPIAAVLCRLYSTAQQSNNIQ